MEKSPEHGNPPIETKPEFEPHDDRAALKAALGDTAIRATQADERATLAAGIGSAAVVAASASDVQALERVLAQYSEDVRSACARASRAIESCRWFDRQQQRFGQQYKQFASELQHFVDTAVEPMRSSLRAHAADLAAVTKRNT